MSRTRATLVVTAVLLTAFDLSVKAWAVRALAAGESVDLQLIQLQLAFNTGVAFSLGNSLPGWVVLTGTGMITAGLAVFIWRTSRAAPLPTRVALAAVLAGATANLIDRAQDGAVTDYLHTGWFPTFNLADVFITLGGVALVLTGLRSKDAAQ